MSAIVDKDHVEKALRERGYRRAWVIDTEYRTAGNHPQARCLCALDLMSSERRDIWLAGKADPPCPFAMASDELFIFFAADADINIFLTQRWPTPRHVIDPRVEFIRVRNGFPPLKPLEGGDPDIAAVKEAKAAKKRHKKPGRFSLSRIARHYKIPFIDDEAKGEFRDLALRPSDDFSTVERQALIDYCRGDVDATAAIFLRVWDEAELSSPRTLSQALIRGFFMAVAAWVQYVGIPINAPLYRRFASNAPALRSAYIEAQYERFDVYENGSFNFIKFEAFLKREGLLAVWPRTPSGRLATDSKTLERMAHKTVDAFVEFRATVDLLESISFSGDDGLANDKAKGLQPCPDGRVRASLFPFGTKTSRCAPGGRAFLFSNPAWMRFLISPERGRAIAYLDYVTQEPRIAAALSGDAALAELCEREDFHMAMAIACGVAPLGATKETHRLERKTGKTLGLAMMYGGGVRMVVGNAGVSPMRARELLARQRAAFPVFYRWSDNLAYRGLCAAPFWSPLGWRFWPQYWRNDDPPDRTCRNFIIQSTGADILRIAGIWAFEARIAINATVHDAFVIDADLASIERTTKTMRGIMERASLAIIGSTIPVKAEITRYGEQFYDEDGEADFKMLMGMLEAVERESAEQVQAREFWFGREERRREGEGRLRGLGGE
jgi:DNA polymerase I-like protein with 3'-5' exonuclease and polymerase domains